MLEASAEAPASWELMHTESAIRDVVLGVEPDVICYQELPGLVPFVETHRMFPATPETHSGNLAMLVTPRFYESNPRVFVVGDYAILATFDDELTVANVHLMSGRAGAGRRGEQLRRVLEASPTDALLIVGDTNMRNTEIDAIDGLGGVTTEQPPSPTWDSRVNRFIADGPRFTAYFTRWFARGRVEVSDVVVHRHQMGVGGAKFFLSDHFALTGTVTVGQTGAT